MKKFLVFLLLGGAVAAVVTFATDGQRITDVWMMRHPGKLRAWV